MPSPAPSTPSGVNLGSCIAGIPVTLHYTFFLLLALYFVDAFLSYRTDAPMMMLFMVVLYGPVLLFTIVVHEFGHALTTKRMGGEVGGIVLWPLGGFAICGPTEGLGGDLKVALAGPMTHVPMAFLWWCLYVGVKQEGMGLWPPHTIYIDVVSSGASGFFEILAAQAVWLNIVLLCFNLFLPAYPLDGGRIYAASLILVLKMKSQTAAKVTAITAMLISGGMIIWAIILFINRTPGGGPLLGLIGAFVFFQSYELWGAAKRDALDGHPIFGRDCYKEGSGSGSGSQQQGGDGGDEEVPAQTDEAVMT